ncbi:cell envelope biogenesis protein AsmA [Ferrigenium kumadai]|uniref:Cell envelope biogenesis protein AsmA n=1 Tax=Ferrigenium kumadai TaxID=1682490 RepID=A0AAN1SY53_9PROT|nr:AsmA family protein [Ferrigenium kumadai]BBI98711.1 cell envelope biogenesis protein AsmA [Ferrigenium kumadai]
MNKILKYTLIGTGSVVGVAVAGAAYLAATFNPNDYKDRIIQTVKESKQRDLRLDGDITLSFFPSIGANLGKVSLSEYKSDHQFAAVESARVSLALMPLLSKKVVVDEVAVSGLQATLVKHKDGTTNIDDLLGKNEKKTEEKQQVEFDIASVSIEKTALTYRDEGTGAQYAIKDLNLHTGRIANGVPGKVDLAATVQANQPKLDINTQLKTTLTFDLDKQQYRVEGLDLQANGVALDIANLKLQASGDANADMTTQEFGAQKFALKASGVKGKDNFEASLDAPALSLTKDKFSGDKLTLNAKLDGAMGNLVALLSVPGVEGNAKAFKVGALTLDLDLKQPEQAFKVKLSSPLSGNFEAQQFDFSNLVLAVNASGDKLPNKSVSSEMKGRVQVDAAKQTVQANLAGGLLQSQVKAKVGVNGFAEPAINFDVDVDQFDADLYMPKKTAEASKAAAPEQPLDLSALRKLNLDGSLRIGSLKVANVKTSNVRLNMKARNGQINVAPLSANLYQGSMNGSVSVNAQTTPSITVNQSLNGVNVAALTKDAADFDTLEGKGNVGLNLSMRGDTVSAMKKALNGTMSLNLADGAIKGINIAKKLREAQGMLGKGGASAQTQSADNAEKTDFSELKASFKVNSGVAHNEDLSLKSPLLRVSGNGDIDIGNDRMNYLAKATLAKTLEGQGGKDMVGGITVPVRVSGPFADLKYTLDFGAMVGEAVKEKVKTEVKTKLQDQLKENLKGLFK